MKGLLHYQFINYVRSYRYVPPLSLYVISLIVNYTYTPNPILDSYALTSLYLFFVMGWFTVTLFHAEDEGQKQLTLLHARNSRVYYMALFVIVALIGFVLSFVSVVYPIIIDAFGAKTRLIHIVLGFLSHFGLVILAITLSAIFTRDLVNNRQNTWWGVLSILLISVVIVSIKSIILQVPGIIWLLPPVHLLFEMMSSEDGIETIPVTFYLKFGWVFLYGFLCMELFFFLMKRRRSL